MCRFALNIPHNSFSSFFGAKKKTFIDLPVDGDTLAYTTMFEILVVLALLVAFTSIAVASGPTSIFIDQIEKYALLATCAELELSTIVRNMEWGCGDGGSLQSFACCKSSLIDQRKRARHTLTSDPSFHSLL
jgi:hypothetical protein